MHVVPSRAVAAFAAAAALLLHGAQAQEPLHFKAIGQPLATGLIQKNKEQPFFETLAQKTGLPVDVDYKPLDSTGVKEFEQLRVARTGIYEPAVVVAEARFLRSRTIYARYGDVTAYVSIGVTIIAALTHRRRRA